MPTALYPLRFEPILKRLIWGGRRLETLLHKPLGPEPDYAESWEIADYHEDVSRVAEGPLQGMSLRELIRHEGASLLGPGLADRVQFPLLVKFLDAHQALSVQVHPNDDLGRVLANDNGKTEAWVIRHAEPGSLIYAGLKPGVDRDRFAAALEAGNVEALLHRFEPRPGDCIFIPAGTVHAIGAGIVLAEVQQMSDATFRVYDWGRVGSDGRPRPLHKDQALRSIDFERGPVDPIVPQVEPQRWGTRERLIHCPYFALERLTVREPCEIGAPDRFTIVMGLEGSAEVLHEGRPYPVEPGATLLLPAAIGRCAVRRRSTAPGEPARLLTCTVP